MDEPRISAPEIGQAIAISRILKGIDQRSLAQNAGMRNTRLCQIERGQRPVTLREIAQIATALDKS